MIEKKKKMTHVSNMTWIWCSTDKFLCYKSRLYPFLHRDVYARNSFLILFNLFSYNLGSHHHTHLASEAGDVTMKIPTEEKEHGVKTSKYEPSKMCSYSFFPFFLRKLKPIPIVEHVDFLVFF